MAESQPRQVSYTNSEPCREGESSWHWKGDICEDMVKNLKSWSYPESYGPEEITMCVCSVIQSCLILWDPMNYSPPGSSVHGILQSRILEWVAMPSSRESFWPRDWTHISCIGRWFFTTEPPGKPEEITNPPLPHWKTDRQTHTHTDTHTHLEVI